MIWSKFSKLSGLRSDVMVPFLRADDLFMGGYVGVGDASTQVLHNGRLNPARLSDDFSPTPATPRSGRFAA
jgi:hypothetical protein